MGQWPDNISIPVTLTFWCKRYTCVRGRRKGRRRAYQDPDHGSSNKKTLNFNFELKALSNEQINSQNIKKSVYNIDSNFFHSKISF